MFNNRYVFIQARWLHFSFELVSTLGASYPNATMMTLNPNPLVTL